MILGLPLGAQVQNYENPTKTSFGLGFHTQGMMLSAMYTGSARFGFFAGIAYSGRTESQLPTEAYLSSINYNREDWLDKSAYFGGLALRVSPRFQIGLGYGSRTTNYYRFGYSEISGLPFRLSASRGETKSGFTVMIDAGSPSGIGVHAVAGPSSIGVGLSYRF